MKITGDMLIADVVDKYPEVVPALMGSGMGCIGCAIAHAETIEQGAMAHGLDVAVLLEKLNQAVATR